jgi:uncharacterized protein
MSPAAITRIVLRPIASSLPVGFIAFGAGTVLLTALELGWVPASQGSTIMVLLLAFVVPLEAVAGLVGFMARDGGAGTGLTVLSAAWAGTAITLMKLPAGGRSTVLGIFLLFLAFVMVLLGIASLRGLRCAGLAT